MKVCLVSASTEEMMGGKWVEYDLGNNTLAIASVGPQWTPSDQGTGAALEVEDFEGAVKGLKDQQRPIRRRTVRKSLLPDGDYPGPRRQQHRHSQTQTGK